MYPPSHSIPPFTLSEPTGFPPPNLRLYLLAVLVFLIHDPFWHGTRLVVGIGFGRWTALSILFGHDSGVRVSGFVLVGAEDDTGFGGYYYWIVYQSDCGVLNQEGEQGCRGRRLIDMQDGEGVSYPYFRVFVNVYQTKPLFEIVPGLLYSLCCTMIRVCY